jgi:hypothetical protein
MMNGAHSQINGLITSKKIQLANIQIMKMELQ